MIGEKVAGARAVKIRLLLKIVFLFVGTFLHELAHYAAALLFGKPSGFSVVPRISGDRVVLGNVQAGVRYKVLSAFIAAAPLLWWLILYLLLAHFRVIRTTIERPLIHFTFSLDRLASFSLMNVVFFWLAVQLLWAGRLSAQDVKTFFAGLFSLSGLSLALTVATLIFVLHHFHAGIN
jgi:hypothetical protein